MKVLVLIMALMSAVFGATAQQADTIQVLTASEFKNAIDKENVQLVDVRTAKEFDEGSIENALNIDFFLKERFSDEFDKFDKELPIYLYCRSGNRSRMAAKILDSLGFTKIHDLKGGYMGWPYK